MTYKVVSPGKEWLRRNEENQKKNVSQMPWKISRNKSTALHA